MPSSTTHATPFAAMRREGSVLILLHDCPFLPGVGGTECHALDLIGQLKLKHAVLIYPTNPRLVSAALIPEGDIPRAVFCRFPLKDPLSSYLHRHAEAEDLLLYLARLCGVRAVLIEHFRRWPLAAVEVFHRAGLPYVYVSHDFFALCPNLNLVHPKTLQPCGAHSGAPGESENCLRQFFENSRLTPPCELQDLLRRHHELFAGILRDAQAVIFPSESACRRVLAGFPGQPLRARVIPHGYPQPAEIPPVSPVSPTGPLRVAVLGVLMQPAKGSELLLEVLSATRGLPLEWHIFGAVDAHEYRQRLQAACPRAVIHGAYERRDILAKLRAAAVDVALFTPIWEETFSYTLSEVWCAGIPPIVPRLGAPAERVAKSGLGWVIEPFSAAAARQILSQLAQAPAEVVAMRARLAGFKHTSLEEMAAAYRALLAPLLQVAAPGGDLGGPELPQSLANEARLKAAFEASAKTLLLLDERNQFAGVEVLNQATLERCGGALLVRSSGNDPALLLPKCSFVPRRRCVLRLDLAAPAEDELRVYYTTLFQRRWTEEGSVSALVRQGRGEVFIELPAGLAALAARAILRLDPGTLPGEYLLHALELRAVI